jgi:hypothetical protein
MLNFHHVHNVFRKDITLMQKRMRIQFVAKSAKIEVLRNMWGKCFNQLQIKAKKNKDKEMTKVLKKILVIPAHI